MARKGTGAPRRVTITQAPKCSPATTRRGFALSSCGIFRGSRTLPERVRWARYASESPLVSARQSSAQSSPLHPAAAAPTSKKSGTAMSGRRVAAERISAILVPVTDGDCTRQGGYLWRAQRR
jgi:hypothetical protein